MEWIKDWFSKKLIEKYAASAIRKGIIVLATLMLTHAPILGDVANTIIENADKYADALAIALAAFAVGWGWKEKKDKEVEPKLPEVQQ